MDVYKYYVTDISGTKITVSNDKASEGVFSSEELGLLVRFGFSIDSVKIKVDSVQCSVHDSRITLPGELYIEHVDMSNPLAVKLRNSVTMHRIDWSSIRIRNSLEEGRQISGAVLEDGSLQYPHVVGTNQESARLAMVTGMQGFIRNGKLLKVYPIPGVSSFTPGDYCDTICSHAIRIKDMRKFIINIDNRIKHIEKKWLSSTLQPIVQISDGLSTEVLNAIFDVSCEVRGSLSDEDTLYYKFLQCQNRGDWCLEPITEAVLQRYITEYKDIVLLNLKKAMTYSKQDIIVKEALLKAATKGNLGKLSIQYLAAPFTRKPLAVGYIKAGGKDPDILNCYTEIIKNW